MKQATAYFIPSLCSFIPGAWKVDGTYTEESWPEDAVEVSEEDAATYWRTTPPAGKILGVVNGMPGWVDIPPPTHDELVAEAENDKQNLIERANIYMNGKQWPGKAALGRLKGDELAQYNAWLDYLDAIEAVDVTTAPEITWPVQPTV